LPARIARVFSGVKKVWITPTTNTMSASSISTLDTSNAKKLSAL